MNVFLYNNPVPIKASCLFFPLHVIEDLIWGLLVPILLFCCLRAQRRCDDTGLPTNSVLSGLKPTNAVSEWLTQPFVLLSEVLLSEKFWPTWNRVYRDWASEKNTMMLAGGIGQPQGHKEILKATFISTLFIMENLTSEVVTLWGLDESR